jgi:hypothetical protein
VANEATSQISALDYLAPGIRDEIKFAVQMNKDSKKTKVNLTCSLKK